MKKQIMPLVLAIAALSLLVVANTGYYWTPMVGSLLLPLTLLLGLVFIALAVVLVYHGYIAYKENFTNRGRIISVTLLAIVLVSILIKPAGYIDFEQWEGKDLLVAEREGVANCYTILRLKEHGRFKERSACFGVEEIKGNYVLSNDTVYFKNVTSLGDDEGYYQFAVIKALEKNGQPFDLIYYKVGDSTMSSGMTITKNELKN
jgi:hypothetical protein